MKIIDNIIDDKQYFKEVQLKKQIVLHHTAGGGNAKNVIHGWNFNPERIGTAYVIDEFGVIHKAFNPKYWAHHLGLKTANNIDLNKASIGIEVCSWGQLIKDKDGKYWNYINKEVPGNEVVKIGKFRGFEYFHKYNDLKIASLRILLLELSEMFMIPLTYNSDMWDVSQNALNGKTGLYTHVSYSKNKADMNPQPNLLTMLINLTK